VGVIVCSDIPLEVDRVYTPREIILHGTSLPAQPLFVRRVATLEEYLASSPSIEMRAHDKWCFITQPGMYHFYEVTTD
jgi:hypothetical protein